MIKRVKGYVNIGRDARLGKAQKVGAVIDGKTLGSLGNLNDQYEKVKASIEAAGVKIGAAFLPLMEKLTPLIDSQIVPAIQKLADGVGKVVDWFVSLNPETQKLVGGLALVGVAAGPAISAIGSISTAISGVISTVSVLASPAGAVMLGIAAVAVAVLAISGAFDSTTAKSGEAKDKILSNMDSLKTGILERLADMDNGISSFFNRYSQKLGFNIAASVYVKDGKIVKAPNYAVEAGGVRITPSMTSTTDTQSWQADYSEWLKQYRASLPTTSVKSLVPAYASGGFPEDGFFFANHGELLGSFANGKTAVANNDQIISGIASANSGVINAVNAMRNDVTKAIYASSGLYIDNKQLARVTEPAQRRQAMIAGKSFVKR